jgi:hypothetical protein
MYKESVLQLAPRHAREGFAQPMHVFLCTAEDEDAVA